MNRDIELQKIQVLAGSFHTRMSVASSALTSGFIALLVLLVTLYYQGALGKGLTATVVLATGFARVYAVLGVLGLRIVDRYYNNYMDIISSLLKQVERGELLPSLSELRKMRKPKE